MTANKRIVLNTLATYGRSLLSLVLGLFSARWVLMALGKSDLGLFGVVGSIILCIQLLNIVMSTAVARFYAFAIGEAKNLDDATANDLLLRWFNSAVSIHFILPIALILIGYPIGIWAIDHWLVIPEGRYAACYWVFRLSLVAAFFNMATVPYIAMYRAKQLIAELTVWDVARTIITFIGAFMLLHVGGDHLIIYAAIMSLVPTAIVIIQSHRARMQFACCHLQFAMLFDGRKIRQIVSYGLCDLFSSFGCIVRDQGAAFLINKMFGPAINSAYSIANQLSNQTNALANALNGALTPALTTAEGEGQHERMISLANRSCKFCTLLVLLFAIPLSLEADYILKLWLVNPPEYTAMLCRCVLATIVCFKLGWGYNMAICADGRVAKYQFTVGCTSVLTLPAMYVLVRFLGIIGVGYALIANAAVLSLIRALFMRHLMGVSVWNWFGRIVIPIVLSVAVSMGVGRCVVSCFQESITRVFLTSGVSLLGMSVVGWLVCLNSQEKEWIRGRATGMLFGGRTP